MPNVSAKNKTTLNPIVPTSKLAKLANTRGIIETSSRSIGLLVKFGEEEEKELTPAVKEATSKGLNVVGPVPADSVFFQAKNDAYDAVLSLYHDQGHIACKTLDFEGTITLTWGLPFLRSGVDHGTAFDIAGQNKANYISMFNQIVIAADYWNQKKKYE